MEQNDYAFIVFVFIIIIIIIVIIIIVVVVVVVWMPCYSHTYTKCVLSKWPRVVRGWGQFRRLCCTLTMGGLGPVPQAILYVSHEWVGGMKVCVTAKLSLSGSKRKFLYNIFWVASCEYTTFRVYECVSICTYLRSCVYEIWIKWN